MATDSRGPQAAFVFAILGRHCSLQQQAQGITSISLLQLTRPRYPVLAMLSASCSEVAPLRAELQRMRVTQLATPSDLSDIGRRRCVSLDSVSASRMHSGYSYSAIYDKMAVWNLTSYSAVLFLDSDLAVLRPLDLVLDQMLRDPTIGHAYAQDGCFPINHSRNAPYQRRNLGVWGVRPSAVLYRSLRNYMLAARLPCDLTPVQTIARTFFHFNTRQRARFAPFETLKLHQGHNMQPTRHQRSGATSVRECLHKLALRPSDLHVVHWTGRSKPALGHREISDPFERSAFVTYRRTYCAAVSRLLPTEPAPHRRLGGVAAGCKLRRRRLGRVRAS
jgi:hypothetical protein